MCEFFPALSKQTKAALWTLCICFLVLCVYEEGRVGRTDVVRKSRTRQQPLFDYGMFYLMVRLGVVSFRKCTALPLNLSIFFPRGSV